MIDKINPIDFEWRARHQYFAVTAVNLIMLGNGAIVGSIAPALPQLISKDTPLITGPLNSEEISWIGSITNLGALMGTILFGIFAHFSSKRVMEFLALPSTVYWILIFFGNTYYHILLARFLAGWITGGLQTTAVLYICEISNDNIRGRLSSFMHVSLGIGILLAYVVGAFVPYKYIPCIFVLIPLVYVAWFVFIPNTPQHHLRRNRVEKAQSSLKYYKNYEGKSEIEVTIFNVEFERLKLIAQEHTQEKLQISDFANRKAIKGIIIGIALAYFAQLTGCYTVLTYAVYICGKTGTSLDPYMSSIAIAVMLILGNICTTQIVERFSRVCLLSLSLLGCAVALICLSLFSYLSKIGYNLSSFAWVPVFCLGFVVFISSVGFIPISHISRVENLPTKIRTFGLTISIFALNFISFVCVKMFPILLDVIDIHGCMMIFAINCILGSIFIVSFLDETKGQPMDSVQNENSNKTSNC